MITLTDKRNRKDRRGGVTYSFIDQQGRRFVWRASIALAGMYMDRSRSNLNGEAIERESRWHSNIGDIIEMTATIKAHARSSRSGSDGVPYTEITRPTILAVTTAGKRLQII